MPLQLPEADSTPLPHSPLELVVCQLRFEERVAVSDPRTILDIQAFLDSESGCRFSKLEPLKRAQIEFSVGPQSAGAGQTQLLASGWRLRSDDGVWTVTVMPDHVIVETNRYPGWESGFRPVLHALVGAVGKFVQPSFEQRLGLRYINGVHLEGVESHTGWRVYIAPRLLGLLGDDVFGPGVRASQQQVSLELDDDVFCTMRHGLAGDESAGEQPAYVLDYDVYRDKGRSFDPDDVQLASDNFNDFALRLFHASITPELLERLRTP